MGVVLRASLLLRGLVVQKSKLTEDSRGLLTKSLETVVECSLGNKELFVKACTHALEESLTPPAGNPQFCLEQLCTQLCPITAPPAVSLVLTKAASQEDYIRGSMTKNPYSSTQVGPLMRDVKKFICTQLELLSFLEDDFGMELLVNGSIVSLDLSVRSVYEQVWSKQGQGEAAMSVVYRLQGLDGEATEPMIKEVEEAREEVVDAEKEYALAGVMAECGGMRALLQMMQGLSDEEVGGGGEYVVAAQTQSALLQTAQEQGSSAEPGGTTSTVRPG